jgi:hypothetical protein
MQSSTAIAFRALVMLICMISIPLFAIFGRDLPQILKNLVAGRLVIRVTDSDPAETKAPAPLVATSSAAPLAKPSSPFSEQVPYRAGGNDPSAEGARLAAVNPSGDRRENTGSSRPSETPSSTPAPPASFSAEPTSRPIGQNPAAGDASPPGVPAAGAELAGAAAAPQQPVDAIAGNEQFRQALGRLRQLGATHYMLETWGSDNNQYRFTCKVALDGNSSATRYFQAIEGDPWRALQSVLQQVEAWKATPRE